MILLTAGSSDLPDPLQKILPVTAAVSGEDATRNIASALGYQGYLVVIAVLMVIIIIGYLISRFANKRAQSS